MGCGPDRIGGLGAPDNGCAGLLTEALTRKLPKQL